jgi:corrinoid protein of di/trimethylamine methyltransferase
MNLIAQDIRAALLILDEDKCLLLAQQVIDSGINVLEVLENGFIEGMRSVGAKYQSGELYLPELIAASEIMKKCVTILESSLNQNEIDRIDKGTIVIGTVEDDIHDIGKSIVSTLLSSAGFRVIDLGVDVPSIRFIEEADENNAIIIAQSALLTVTASRMAELINLMKEKGIRKNYKVMIGGAAITAEYAASIGADGFGINAEEAVQVAIQLLHRGQERNE